MGPPKVSRSAEALEQSMWPLTPSPAHSSLTPPTPSQPHCELAILACGHFFSLSFPDTSICSVDAVPLAVPPQSVPTFAQPSSTHFPGLDADSPPARSPSRSPWWVVLPVCPQSAWAHPWDSQASRWGFSFSTCCASGGQGSPFDQSVWHIVNTVIFVAWSSLRNLW